MILTHSPILILDLVMGVLFMYHVMDKNNLVELITFKVYNWFSFSLTSHNTKVKKLRLSYYLL